MEDVQYPGTHEITDPGNEYFRDHPQYGLQYLPIGVSDKILQNSHIATTRATNKIPGQPFSPSRIFRQGFQFIESSNTGPGFKMGLNFVSFQK